MSVEINKKGIIILILLVLLFIGIIFKLLPNTEYIVSENPKSTKYTTISPNEVNNLYKNANNLIVVDCSQPKQVYRDGHLPEAVWTPNPELFYNTTNDILVYSNNDTIAKNFCEQLVDNVYGHIYFMPGGYEAWKNQ